MSQQKMGRGLMTSLFREIDEETVVINGKPYLASGSLRSLIGRKHAQAILYLITYDHEYHERLHAGDEAPASDGPTLRAPRRRARRRSTFF